MYVCVNMLNNFHDQRTMSDLEQNFGSFILVDSDGQLNNGFCESELITQREWIFDHDMI